MSDTPNIMRFEALGRSYEADVGKPLSLAIPLDFAGPQPSCFDAPRASAQPLRAGGFVGDTRGGGSCNCEVVTFAPHCNGTHTECVGHVTDERVAVSERVPGGLVLARLVTVAPEAASVSAESSDPQPSPDDRLVTAAALAAACARAGAPLPSALVVRTTSEDPHRAYRGPAPAPFLTREAAAWLVARAIDTLVLDLPSADRADDGGRLTAHRVFFGLPPGSRRAAECARPRACITELAWIAGAIPDGLYLLDLQLPAFVTDAAPSRPLLFAVHPA
jgi:arylformamidase